MAGYTRQSTADILPGQNVAAGPLNDEFNALEAAFAAVTGHTHDGTTGSGPKISLTASVSGILPEANGGTGLSSLTSFVTLTGTQTLTNKTLTSPTINGGTITGITDLAVADGGTGASTAANARTNLGLVIGTNVQAWDADLDTWATKTAPSGTVVGTTDTQTLSAKTLTSPTINSGALSGTFTGAHTITGLKTVSVGDSTTLNNFMNFQPTNYGTGNPRLSITKNTTASSWNIQLFDGVDNSGTINLQATTLTHNTIPIITTTGTQTLTNKTLTSPTINAGALSGTFSGTPTFSGAVAFTGGPTVTAPAGGDNSTKIPSTAWVMTEISAAVGGSGAVTLTGAQTITGLKTISIGTSTTQGSYLEFTPTNYATGNPKLYIQKGSAATQWNFGLFDTVNTTGTINFDVSSLTWNGVSIVGTTSTQTLTNKTLTSPTINSPTIATATFTGNQTFSGIAHTFNGAGNVNLEIGRTDGSSSTPFIDFHSGATAVDYDSRIIASGGTGSIAGGTLDFSTTTLTHNSVPIVTTTGTQTLTNKTLTSPTIAGGALSGTFSGNHTYSGIAIFSAGMTSTSTGNMVQFRPTNFATDNPYLYIGKDVGTADRFDIGLTDGTDSNGTINFVAGTALTWNGVQLVTTTGTQTLTNKTITRPTITLQDSITTFQDNSDNTKQMQFELSGITTGNTRTLTVPNFNGTIATLAGTETFTNKTLTSPTINGATLSGTLSGTWTSSGTVTNSGSITGGTVDATNLRISGNDVVGWVKLSETSMSSTSVAISIPTGYHQYKMVIEDCITSNVAQNDTIQCHVSVDGGSSYVTTSSYQNLSSTTFTAFFTAEVCGASALVGKSRLSVIFEGLTTGSYPAVIQHGVGFRMTSGNNALEANMTGSRVYVGSSTSVTHIRINNTSGGTFDGGVIYLYGLRDT